MAKKLVNIRVSDEIKAVLAALVKRERRSITGEIEVLIVERAKALGLLPPAWKPEEERA